MKRNLISAVFFCLVFSLLLLSCSQKPKDSSGSDKATATEVLYADSLWSVAAATVDGHMSYFSEDAIVLAPNEPLISGKEAIRKMLEEMHTNSGFSVKWQADQVDAEANGKLAYTKGSYELTMNDASGNPVTDKGKYLTVWKKQADGSWKVKADMFNSDLPASAGH